jgi:dipeptide/tripeptide permease
VRGEPAEVRGKITGIFTGSIDAGAFIGSIILGQIGEWAGFPTLFLAAGVALLLGLGVFRLGR